MSRTFTNRSSVSGDHRASGGMEGDKRQGDNPRRPTVADRTQRRDAYTVIAPDEEKRKTVQENAAKEEQQFQEFRERNRMQHVSYVGTVGGGDAAVDVQRRSALTDTQQPRLTPFEKTRQYRAAQRQRQEDEITKKKEKQRLKAAANEDHERQRKQRLDEDRKKKMSAFLDQFESNLKLTNTASDSTCERETELETRSDDGCQSSLDLLQSAFPNHPRQELEEMLTAFGGDVDSVFEMMSS